MFFTRFDPLTEDYVSSNVIRKARADGESCGCLAGRAFTVRLEGDYAPEELRYELLDGDTLLVTENGSSGTIGYSLVSMGPIMILSHIPREVQRQYYFGWLDFGDNERPQLNTPTNRIEGRGLHWLFDTGYEILTFNPSVCCTTFTELGGELGGITLTNPADYIRIDDEYYIYSRCEVEFSGKLWLEVVGFFDMEAVGLEFGFEEDNSFTYRTHRARIKITGDAAHLEKINDFGNRKNPHMAMAPGKGARYSYRPMDIDVPMPREEALRHAAERRDILESSNAGIMDSRNTLPLCYDLVGKRFRVWPDNEKYAQAPWSGKRGKPWEYHIVSDTVLRWRRGGGRWQEEKYNCFQPDKHLYFFSHMLTGDERHSLVSQVVDFDNALATTVVCGIGNWHSEWEAGADVFFGTLEYGELQPPFARRHHFTDDLLGHCFAWAYSESMNSIHIYSSPESYSWTILQDDNAGGATWSSPCFYIKLRPEVYLFQWVEENCNGMQCLVVMNRKLQHDGGFSYGVSRNGLTVHITGAYQRDLGYFDIRKYFGR